jgi:50S ribosomal protein L16 3-hydroxylase
MGISPPPSRRWKFRFVRPTRWCHTWRVFGSLSQAQFLERHWQRSPLFLQGALPGFRSPLSPDELAGLACEESVESRLVQGHVGAGFRLERGPFEEKRFARLPKRNWTLLVQDVDKHVPEVASLLEPFRFLPDWRVDDIMVSFAAPGGSVGPHTDQYDVFLLQVQGKRRWQISEHFAPELREDCELRVLQHFEPERELIAEPGDILYLPPNVAHHGVAIDDAMTFSIGFRAPDQRELLVALAQELVEGSATGPRFGDAGRSPSAKPEALDPADLARLRELVRSGLAQSDAQLDAFIGRYLTRAKSHLVVSGDPSGADEVAARLARGDVLRRRHGSRWATLESGAELVIFAEGHECRLKHGRPSWLEPLLASLGLSSATPGLDAAALVYFAAWLEQGALEWQDDDDD